MYTYAFIIVSSVLWIVYGGHPWAGQHAVHGCIRKSDLFAQVEIMLGIFCVARWQTLCSLWTPCVCSLCPGQCTILPTQRLKLAAFQYVHTVMHVHCTVMHVHCTHMHTHVHTCTHTHRPDTVDLLDVLVTPGVQDGNKGSLKNYVRTLSVVHGCMCSLCCVHMIIHACIHIAI